MPAGLVFILCTVLFLSIHYPSLLPFAPLFLLHAPGPSHCGAILLNQVGTYPEEEEEPLSESLTLL